MKLTKEVEVELTPDELAGTWELMNSVEQAQFFSALADRVAAWDGGMGTFLLQLQAITDRDELTFDGRRVMEAIGDYSHAPGIY